MEAFLAQDVYFNDFKSKPLPDSPPQHIDDYVVTGTPDMASFCRSAKSWQLAVPQLREQIFNSSSTSIAAPGKFFLNQINHNSSDSRYQTLMKYIDDFQFNSDPLSSFDIFTYRQSRSENLLLRMLHCCNLDINQMSLMRLSKGVFVHQKEEDSTPHPSPTLSAIEDTLLNECLDTRAEAPINTFGYDYVYHMINNIASSCYESFAPYSYTFGARYTNPYRYASDLMIRGKIPLWCQLLFLSSCMEQPGPIKPNVPYYGLFPFAPQVPVTFKRLIEEPESAVPDLTIKYEHFTLESIDPYSDPDESLDQPLEVSWSNKRKEVYNNMLICNLPDNLAKALCDISAMWAAGQGLVV